MTEGHEPYGGAKRLDPKETTDTKELIVSMVYTEEAIIRLLERKGILTEQEVLDEIKRIRNEHEKNKGTVSH